MDHPSDYEDQHDETLARAEEEDPSEEYPTDDELERGPSPVSPQTVRDLPVTPPRSIIVIEDSDEMVSEGVDTEIAEEFEEEIPDDVDTEMAPESDSEVPPPPPPASVMSIDEFDMIVDQHTTELAVTRARVEELRMQLAAERRERRLARREMERHLAHRESRGSILERLGRVTRRIERRALAELRSLAHDLHRRIRRSDAEGVIERAMRRVRRATRSQDD